MGIAPPYRPFKLGKPLAFTVLTALCHT